MNHMQVLKRAWTILWSYRALWIFGILIALTSGGSFSASSSSRAGSSGSTNGTFTVPPNFPPEWSRWMNQINEFFSHGMTPTVVATLIGIGIGLLCLGLLIAILFNLAKYVSRVALIGMVDHHEGMGEKLSWRKGLRLGWSRSAWRLFLIDFVIHVPIALVAIVLFVFAAIPALLGAAAGHVTLIVGVISTIGLVFLLIFFMLLVSLCLALVMETIYRVCVLKGTGVFDSIREGWHLVRHNLKDIFLMWLILVGIQIGFSLVSIPVVIALLLVALLIGGGVGFVAYLGIHVLAALGWAVVAAVIIGLIIFIILISIPMLFLRGLLETYLSTSWTLTYRAISPVFPEVPAPVIEPVQPDDF